MSDDELMALAHVSREQALLYQGGGIASFLCLSYRLNEFRRRGQIPDDFDELGVEDDMEDDGSIVQTVRWARRGSYGYVPSEQTG